MSTITIREVLAAPGLGSFFFDDQAAIKAGAQREGAAYTGQARTPGFKAIREPSDSVSVMLVLSDGYVANGDCASVQYTGVGGREPRFHNDQLAAQIEQQLAPRLRGLNVLSFRQMAISAERIIEETFQSPRAAAYGISQALLDAAAHVAGHHLMAQVIKDEWHINRPLGIVPIYGQCGDERYRNVDKMISKNVPVLPHGLINTPELVGVDGEKLEEYIRWVNARISLLRVSDDYRPVIHIDVYGLIGACAAGSIDATAKIIQRLESAAYPHQLRIEHPLDAGGRDAQIEALGSLRRTLIRRGCNVGIVADEWANTVDDVHRFAEAKAVDMVHVKTPDLGSFHNTVDAILDCHQHGVGPFLGGSCTETDLAARATANVGIATGVTQVLAKPGMGFDEGFSIVLNEMKRVLRVAEMLS